jgi:SAM-dependent methyltransferase
MINQKKTIGNMQHKDTKVCLVCSSTKFRRGENIKSIMPIVPEGITRANKVHVILDRCSGCGLLIDRKYFNGYDYESLYSKDTIYSKSNYDFSNFPKKYSTDPIDVLAPYLNKSITALEIGFCTTELMQRVGKKVKKISGLELDPLAVKKAVELGFDAREGSVKQAFGNVKFDLIYAIALFEHLTSPKEWLNEVYSHLNAGGLVLIQLPNPQSLNALISRIFSRHSWDMFTEPGHVAHYRKRHLKKLFENSGFRPKRFATSTIRVRGKIPLIPGRPIRLESYIQKITLNSSFAMKIYTGILVVLDILKIGDTQILIFEKK